MAIGNRNRFGQILPIPLAERKSMAERLWSKVRKTEGCWLWTGATFAYGYGQITTPTRTRAQAHRVMWELMNGPIPTGLVVCHRCDNPPCVRPDHLFLGTQLDNIKDRCAKHRSARGRRVRTTKLTPEQVAHIRAVAVKGTPPKSSPNSYADLARQFGIATGSIRAIVIGRSWKND